jgi:hypothetical protein
MRNDAARMPSSEGICKGTRVAMAAHAFGWLGKGSATATIGGFHALSKRVAMRARPIPTSQRASDRSLQQSEAIQVAVPILLRPRERR